MAKKASNEVAPPFERIISKTIPNVVVSKSAEETEWTTYNTSTGKDWKPVPAYPLALYYEDTIDLSGYSLQDLTYFPQVGFNLSPNFYSLRDGGGLIITTLISNVQIDPDMLYLSGFFGGQLDASIGGEEWNSILFNEFQLYQVDAATPSAYSFARPTVTSQVGSLAATAVDKLFIYKFVLPLEVNPGSPDFTNMRISSSRLGLIGQMAEEPTLEYMMRLKRSYELANQV